MTRTEAIFDMIRGLPELELTELLEMVRWKMCEKPSDERMVLTLNNIEEILL